MDGARGRGLGVGMVESLVKAGVVFLTIGGLAYLAGLAVAHGVEQATLRRLRADDVDGRLQAMATLARRFQERKDALLPVLARLDMQAKSLRRRHYMATRKRADMKVARSRLVRVLGEEEAFHRPERPSRKFSALVINRHVQRAILEQKTHAFLGSFWNRAQQVDVWAPTIGDAKLLVERHFPPATGFFIIEITEPGEPHGGDASPAGHGHHPSGAP